MISLDKKTLRTAMIKELKSISHEERKAIEKKLAMNLFTSRLWNNASMIGVTMSQGSEWDTREIIEMAWSQKKQVCIPKCIPKDKKMIFYQFESCDQLEKGYNHLLEPIPAKTTMIVKKTIDLLIVPGLLFDKKGFRIGFGGGYYDRFLQDFSNDTVSLLSYKQLVGQLPKEPFDIPVSYLITEDGMIQLND